MLTDGVAGDLVELDYGLSSGTTAGVKQVQFSDGTTWTAAQLVQAETTGTSGVDALYGTTGAEFFDGKGGADFEYGRGGNDTYSLVSGYGRSTIVNGTATSNVANGDLSIVGEDPDNIWLQRSGNNLQIDIMGTATQAIVQNWYSATYSQLGEITVSGSMTLDSQISQLVQAMATFSGANPGFDPTSAANSVISDPTVLTAVHAAWHQ